MSEPTEEHKPDLPHGAYAQIARRLRPPVTLQHVREVALGRRQSKRVAAAIRNYVARLEREQEGQAVA